MMGENGVGQRMWDAVHRQDEAEETERRTDSPGATPEEVGEDETHRMMQVSLRQEEGASFTSQETGQKKGSNIWT